LPQSNRVKSLEINQDISFQQKEWKVERAGWIVMAGIVLLALLGLFGGGPLSTVTQKEPGGFQITHERFDRQMNPSKLTLQLPPDAIQGGQARFWIDRNYLEKVQIEDISPAPGSTEVSAERLIYTVKVADPSQPVTIKLDIRLEDSGLVEGEAGWEGGGSASFSQFVFP
jgi:hypothetical protein